MGLGIIFPDKWYWSVCLYTNKIDPIIVRSFNSSPDEGDMSTCEGINLLEELKQSIWVHTQVCLDKKQWEDKEEPIRIACIFSEKHEENSIN